MHQKKVTSKTSLTNMSKSEKSAYFRHVFANNFFWVHWFSNLFQRIRNQREILRFLIPILNFLINNFFCSYYHFLYTLIENAQETARKTGNLFLWMCLRILLGNHQRVCITKLLKSLYPTPHAVHYCNWLASCFLLNSIVYFRNSIRQRIVCLTFIVFRSEAWSSFLEETQGKEARH